MTLRNLQTYVLTHKSQKKREAHRKSRLIKRPSLRQEDKGLCKWLSEIFGQEWIKRKTMDTMFTYMKKSTPLRCLLTADVWNVATLQIKCCNTSLDVAIAIKDHWNVPIPPLEGSGVQEQLETGAWHCRCLVRWKPNLSHTCVAWSSCK